MLRRALISVTLISMVTTIAQAVETPLNSSEFATTIVPILRDRCLGCHHKDNAEGDVDLSTVDSLIEDEWIVPGDWQQSELRSLLVEQHGEPPRMPKDAKPLSSDAISQLEDWVSGGAEWPESLVLVPRPKGDASWWAFQPLEPKLVEAVSSELESKTPDQRATDNIDRIVANRLAQSGLGRNPEADRVALIRRATYDLLGLPPTPEEVERFVNDASDDAYERLVDRLLASPHYGEHWGRHWLDVVRFGESVGFERNNIIDSLWPFRDYVIASLNEDKAFDQMIREHLAGDVLAENVPQDQVVPSLLGSSFLVAGPHDNVNNQDADQQKQIRANTIDEIIRATSEAFLGVTIGCARCHDHKFDPVTQKDYYSLYSTFAGVQHGKAPVAVPEQIRSRTAELKPLEEQRATILQAQAELQDQILERGRSKLESEEKHWVRPSVDRTGTIEEFEPVDAKFVRLVCEAQDINLKSSSGFRLDEFEIWTTDPVPRNVALSSTGAVASGKARQIEDFPGAYGAQLAIDGLSGARFIAASNSLTIELAKRSSINRVQFSSARDEANPLHRKFTFVAEYRIETSIDGTTWKTVADGHDRKPTKTEESPDGSNHLNYRLAEMGRTDSYVKREKALAKQLREIGGAMSKIRPMKSAWIGSHDAEGSKGPFHVFIGGDPKRGGDQITASSMVVFNTSLSDQPELAYQLDEDSHESQRRLSLANWMTDPQNPLTPRVLANRLWHYHFGTGIVDTPNDFGYMGGPPSHPMLLDYLAAELLRSEWKLKPVHKIIMMSKSYRQSSTYKAEAAATDADARLLWRYPPRRLSAEQIRDSILQVAGVWQRHTDDLRIPRNGQFPIAPDGGPGFRLYHYMQDNVATYKPLDEHGPNTYRRAVYHQNARASVVDLMTDFDQPDCAFSAPRRAETTTPLQALTMLNHQFTLQMSDALSSRVIDDSRTSEDANPIRSAFALCFSRQPTDLELTRCATFAEQHGMPALCRVLLNTSEFVFLR